jgi:hypothetical protein
MFPIKKQLIFIWIILAFVVSTSLGQSRQISPDYLRGEWVGSFSWKRDTTSYSTIIDFRSPGICRLSIMDGKVNLALQVASFNQTQVSYIVDPDMSDPNPLFISARLTITKLSDYISCVCRVAFAFEGEEEQWSGFLFRMR